MNRTPLIFDMRHFALDDGPGIRTTVFIKGCPLSCVWCHNPESFSTEVEIAFYPQLCISCGLCSTMCPQKAVTIDNPNRINRVECIVCGKCAEQCPTAALKKVGEYYSQEELIEILLSDQVFYDASEGGITFSGGEPTLFMNYITDVMKELKRNKVNVAIQTSGMFDLSEFRSILLPFIDIIFFDIKIYDFRKHLYYTGQGNKQILSNFLELSKESTVSLIPTIPLIPGITATPDNLKCIAGFLSRAGCSYYEFKPYNPGGISKRIMRGKSVPRDMSDIPANLEELKRIKQLFKTHYERENLRNRKYAPNFKHGG